MTITYYLEVISSWCYWAEPTWAELKRRYAGRVDFQWKIAQMPAEGYPASQSQCDWFYRRSGTITHSPFMLNSGWIDPDIRQYTVPNLVAEAARELGVADDSVRLAIANAALRQGRKIGRWEVAVEVAARTGNLDPARLETRARSEGIQRRVQATTDEFLALQVTQRPTFLVTNRIGDRALYSGILRVEPLAAAIDALMADEAAYGTWRAHFGDPPAA